MKMRIEGTPWRTCFAWSPVTLTGGRVIWLRTYETRTVTRDLGIRMTRQEKRLPVSGEPSMVFRKGDQRFRC